MTEVAERTQAEILTGLEDLLLGWPELAQRIFDTAHKTVNPGVIMTWGMSAHGGTDRAERAATLLALVHKAKADHFGWNSRWGQAYDVMDDGIRYGWTLWDDHGESSVTYFTYKTWLDCGLDEVAVLPTDNTEEWDEFITDRLPVMLGIGPCQCSHCLNDWDCCGNMSYHHFDVWPANEAHTLWYGKVYGSRNI